MSIDPSTLVLMIINFIVLMLLLNKFLFKPVLGFMQQRQQRIDAGLEAGRKAKEIMQQKQEQISAMKAAAKKDSADRISEAVHQSEEAVKESMKARAGLIQQRRQSEAAKLYEEEEQLVTAVEQDINSFLNLLQNKIQCAAKDDGTQTDNWNDVGLEYREIVLDAMGRSGISPKGGAEQV